ncbi:molybdopterin synthase catalytic subunit-like [Siniperca chuatsi]|uniref:molybdopterin synthase catalytic subunit-like n=1 Tax=Siniperca chuatsi TaxID=119488 RepID=UPI001CE206CF|nr:molybdopterin synthase catalytic subunit-like [Siniperca chuatsi]
MCKYSVNNAEKCRCSSEGRGDERRENGEEGGEGQTHLRTLSLRWVEVGQASVAMAISSPHRHDGQQAIQHCIHQLKANIPIWKKEVYDTQDSSWKENAECSWAARNKLHGVTSSTENV